MIDRQAAQDMLGRSAAFAALSAAIVALRIVERGESLHSRTLLLLAIVAAGAALAGFATFGSACLLARRWPAVLRGAAAAPFAAGAFAGFAVLIFAVLRQSADVEFDAEDHHAFAWIGLLQDALGLFVTTGARYWLPWPLPLIGLAGGLLAALPFQKSRKADAPIILAVPAR